MSIPARVLLLLACGPLLQPPGVCACKFASAGFSPPGSGGPVEAAEPRPAPPKAGCCSHRHAEAPARPAAGSTPRPCRDTDDHSPGCPASPEVNQDKWVEPTVPLSLVLPPPVNAAPPPVDAAGVSAPVVSPATNRPSSPPLYLSHCSLVI